MAVTIHWETNACTTLYVAIHHDWDRTTLPRLTADLVTLLADIDHTVDLILDLTHTPRLPGSALDQFAQMADPTVLPAVARIAVVSGNVVVKAVIIKLHESCAHCPDRLHFFPTLKAADAAFFDSQQAGCAD